MDVCVGDVVVEAAEVGVLRGKGWKGAVAGEPGYSVVLGYVDGLFLWLEG